LFHLPAMDNHQTLQKPNQSDVFRYAQFQPNAQIAHGAGGFQGTMPAFGGQLGMPAATPMSWLEPGLDHQPSPFIADDQLKSQARNKIWPGQGPPLSAMPVATPMGYHGGCVMPPDGLAPGNFHGLPQGAMMKGGASGSMMPPFGQLGKDDGSDPADMNSALRNMDFSFLGDNADAHPHAQSYAGFNPMVPYPSATSSMRAAAAPFMPSYGYQPQQSPLPMKVMLGTDGQARRGGPGGGQDVIANFAHSMDQQRGQQSSEYPQCRWHESASAVGRLTDDGHIFTKKAGPRQSRVSDKGRVYELATICMVFDASLRSGGVHRYQFYILGGEFGPADGAGFTFDTKVRRRSIQQMCAVFLNQRGCICLRRRQHVTKLPARLPPLTVGVLLTMIVDLNMEKVRFEVSKHGAVQGSADVSVSELMGSMNESESLRSGFFCAVVTGNISVGLY